MPFVELNRKRRQGVQTSSTVLPAEGLASFSSTNQVSPAPLVLNTQLVAEPQGSLSLCVQYMDGSLQLRPAASNVAPLQLAKLTAEKTLALVPVCPNALALRRPLPGPLRAYPSAPPPAVLPARVLANVDLVLQESPSPRSVSMEQPVLLGGKRAPNSPGEEFANAVKHIPDYEIGLRSVPDLMLYEAQFKRHGSGFGSNTGPRFDGYHGSGHGTGSQEDASNAGSYLLALGALLAGIFGLGWTNLQKPEAMPEVEKEQAAADAPLTPAYPAEASQTTSQFAVYNRAVDELNLLAFHEKMLTAELQMYKSMKSNDDIRRRKKELEEGLESTRILKQAVETALQEQFVELSAAEGSALG